MTTAPTKSSGVGAKKATDRIYNFSAGPAVLPETVLRQAQQDIWNIAGSGIGILEHSHRGKVFDRIIAEAEADCRTVGGIGDDHAVLFLQGGATLQFAMVPMNFLPKGRTADYVDTGVWANKAIKDAKKLGTVHVAFDGNSSGYDHTPDDGELKWSKDPVYAHYCSNNTIYGTRFRKPPKAPAPLVADMSSEIFSRPWDVAPHAIIYAGAQKNIGPAGVTLVIIRKDLLERCAAGLPSILDYKQHAENESRLNTPPTFGIYVAGLVFKWIMAQGGLAALEQRNQAKARIIYDAVDGSGGFYGAVARADSRSIMNVCFRTPSADLDEQFVKEAKAQSMDGLKGHRNVGGLRASIYNAFPVEGCQALSQFMKEFSARNG